GLSHHGNDPGRVAGYARIGLAHTRRLARFLDRLATIPDAFGSRPEGMTRSQKIIAGLRDLGFRLRLRAVFMLVSSLALVWLYRLVLRWRRSGFEALLAACFLGSSFEVAYHSRWIAPDALLMQFGALTLMAVFAAVQAQDGRRWLIVAAIAAGLGCGSKYPGGLLCMPVCVAAFMVAARLWPEQRLRPLLLLLVKLAVVFVLTFLVTTPGMIFEWDQLWTDIEFEREHYADGHHVYTLEPGLGHLGRMFEYLGGQMLSPHSLFAWMGMLFVVVGIYAVLRERPALALLALIFPILYLAFMSSVKVMIVRNILVLAPFMALFATRGASFLYERIRPRQLRFVLPVLILSFVLANYSFLVWSSERTANRSEERSLAEFVDHARAHPDTNFVVAPRVRAGLASLPDPGALSNVKDRVTEDSDALAIFANECGQAQSWQVGPIDLIWFGPYEINFRYYPSAWNPKERLLVMPLETAQLCGIPGY
ncbi:MAG: glycosyltransferase family 39 protein, partial [Candidatus Poseidoniia archaeon]